jgi:hypothetical protein
MFVRLSILGHGFAEFGLELESVAHGDDLASFKARENLDGASV